MSNNSMLILSPTKESDQEDTKIFAPKLLIAIKSCLDNIVIPNFDLNNEIATKIIDSFNGIIIKIGQEVKE